MNYLITTVRDHESYRVRVGRNKAVREFKHLLAEYGQGGSIADGLNSCLDGLPEDADSWLLIIPDALEFTSPPELERLSPDNIYGIFGARVSANLRKKKFVEYLGKLVTIHNYIQAPNPLLEYRRTYGASFHEGSIVETLGPQCLLVHSSLLRRHKLRFDPELKCCCLAEDFCLQAGALGVKSMVISQPCRLHVDAQPPSGPLLAAARDYEYYSNKHSRAENGTQPGKLPPCTADPLMPLPEAALKTFAGVVLPQENDWSARIGVYHHKIQKDNFNHTAVLAAEIMRPNSKILDIGAAFGDNGQFFQEQLQANLWGLEYDKFSLDHAATRNIYTELFHENLETMALSDYSKYYGFFTHIFIGDVLEHLRDPKTALINCAELLEPGGSFVVSLPNVGHSYVTLNLLEGEFEYSANGILDATHLRFYTARGQARVYAECGLAVKQAVSTFMIPGEFKSWGISFDLPESIYDFVFSDMHALTMQYICELERSAQDVKSLFEHNLAAINQAPENNPRGWIQKRGGYEMLRRLLKEHKQGRS